MKKEECDARMEHLLKGVTYTLGLRFQLSKKEVPEYPKEVVTFIEEAVRAEMFRKASIK